MYKQYQVPSHSGVPNPWGPRLHNWKGGELNEGSLYHGPVYTRPMFRLPWKRRPLQGIGATAIPDDEDWVLLAIYGGVLRFAHPDLFEKMDARFDEAVEGTTDEEFTAYIDHISDCVRKHAPALAAEAEGISIEEVEADDEELPPGTFVLSRKEAEAVDKCMENRGADLGVLIPLAAAGVLLVWLYARR